MRKQRPHSVECRSSVWPALAVRQLARLSIRRVRPKLQRGKNVRARQPQGGRERRRRLCTAQQQPSLRERRNVQPDRETDSRRLRRARFRGRLVFQRASDLRGPVRTCRGRGGPVSFFACRRITRMPSFSHAALFFPEGGLSPRDLYSAFSTRLPPSCGGVSVRAGGRSVFREAPGAGPRWNASSATMFKLRPR